jgi:hypothetical protein
MHTDELDLLIGGFICHPHFARQVLCCEDARIMTNHLVAQRD